MNLERLHAIIADCVTQHRKGEAVIVEKATPARPIQVTHVYAMPHVSEAPPAFEQIDVHFFVAVVDKSKAETHRAELLALLAEYPDLQELGSGPSYIAVGARIGDQGAALCLFALGAVLELWMLITPATLGLAGAQADRAAGAGYVMCSGWRQ